MTKKIISNSANAVSENVNVVNATSENANVVIATSNESKKKTAKKMKLNESISKRVLKDGKYKTDKFKIEEIENTVVSSSLKKIIDQEAKILGRYDATTNTTKDAYGKILFKGNMAGSLIGMYGNR